MKKILFSLLVVLVSAICYSQSSNLVGAWLWRDSKTSFSLFIKEDGSIEKFTRPINDPTPPKNSKKGTYKFIDNKKLIIIWSDKSTEVNKIEIIDNGTLKIELKTPEGDTFKTFIFKKVFDEEVEL